jgi:hypothetical protein
MQTAWHTSNRLIAVLSPDCLAPPVPQAEWSAVLAADAAGARRCDLKTLAIHRDIGRAGLVTET